MQDPMLCTSLILAMFCMVSTVHSDYCEKEHCDGAADTKPKVILFWTYFYGHYDFTFGYGREPFIEAGCKVTNCRTTANKSESDQADALLFHMRNVNSRTPFPENRKPNQQYVFFLMEHPHNQWNDLRKWAGYFNLTMTYRRDSDIPLLYGRTVALESEMSHNQDLPEKKYDEDNRKQVAWFVSNCESYSKREVYVKELQNYIPVDIYGRCGPLDCPEGNKIREHEKREHPSCYKMLHHNYKFYLSFESIHCKDYVTEKLYDILNNDTIPVVMGYVDYKEFAPPNSVIHVEDFKSPKQLAEYLLHLEKSPEEYWNYKAWRKTHKVHGKRHTFLEAFCHLCEILNDPQQSQKQHDDLHQWWGKDTVCTKTDANKMKASWT